MTAAADGPPDWASLLGGGQACLADHSSYTTPCDAPPPPHRDLPSYTVWMATDALQPNLDDMLHDRTSGRQLAMTKKDLQRI